jgi:hypothetical protein
MKTEYKRNKIGKHKKKNNFVQWPFLDFKGKLNHIN